MTELNYTSDTSYDLERPNPDDAGLDLTSNANISIPAGGRAQIPTGYRFAFPKGHYATIESRSGLFFKHGIEAFRGIIDQGYRGEIIVGLKNTSNKRYDVLKGDRIAQLILHPQATFTLNKIEEFTTATSRGNSGFGSSGY